MQKDRQHKQERCHLQTHSVFSVYLYFLFIVLLEKKSYLFHLKLIKILLEKNASSMSAAWL